MPVREIIGGRGLNAADRQSLARAEKVGRIRRLASGLYTSNLILPPEEVVRRNALHLAAAIQPDGVLSGRSGFELLPSRGRSGLHLFVAGGNLGQTVLPGLTVHRTGGPGPLEGDIAYMGLHIPSKARRWLENLVPGRARANGAGIAHTTGRPKVEQLVSQIFLQQGASRLAVELELARRLAPVLGLTAQLEELEKMIASALMSRPGSLDCETR
jgi:hypothetical protein